MPKPRIPAHRLHKPTQLGVVTLNGRDYYTGKHGTPASQVEYDRLIAEWLSCGRQLSPRSGGPTDMSVGELLLAYVTFAVEAYAPPSLELEPIKRALKPVRELYGNTLVTDFGPMALKTVRLRMIEQGLCRREINKRIGRIVRAFAWAVENEMAPRSLGHALKAVENLKPGRSKARESKPVRPVPEQYVEAIKPHVLPPVRAMIDLQQITGMRPGEVCIMRTGDIDMTGQIWLYTPQRHKTQYRGHDRLIALGPKAQEILRPWLRLIPEAPLFSPREAVEQRRAERRLARKTPVYGLRAKGVKRRKRNPKRQPRACYDVRSYHHAIARGCKKAGVPHWHPHQLRHNAATRLRREFGLDAARVVLGHRSPKITETYAELDFSRAAEVMASVG